MLGGAVDLRSWLQVDRRRRANREEIIPMLGCAPEIRWLPYDTNIIENLGRAVPARRSWIMSDRSGPKRAPRTPPLQRLAGAECSLHRIRRIDTKGLGWDDGSDTAGKRSPDDEADLGRPMGRDHRPMAASGRTNSMAPGHPLCMIRIALGALLVRAACRRARFAATRRS